MAKNKKHPFFKMTGGGNDFVVFDNRKKTLPKDYSKIATQLCQRKFSVGADGLLVLENSKRADFRMIYYNADGSRAEMCGNGARCIARFAHLKKAAKPHSKFETDAGILSAEIKHDVIKIGMSTPSDLRLDLLINLENRSTKTVSHVNTGVPHACVLVDSLEKTDVNSLGRMIRRHDAFLPKGANVNFIETKNYRTLHLRTYERGVEGETLACGTGAVASSIICGIKGLVASPVSCVTRGGEILNVYFKLDRNQDTPIISQVFLEGPVVTSYEGEVTL